ncbi:molybdopterin synthase sulfur carrier subunit [Vibrio diazotrophicus]|uniref:molybdopterin synthase sulfur carrier subunit n=1 Tax=Vibrio diazotrophicus TaxID=685 RepID=UPI0005A63A29|nr:molybdopterin synthase sulfur carrier subunit [Vibrio diazotrophicus]
MISILFFAQTRELVDCDGLSLEHEFDSVEALRAHLVAQSDKWALALESGKLLAAVNQSIVPMDSELKDGDEVAFFPPVTGG